MIKIQPTTLPQVFWEFMIDFQFISLIVLDLDDSCQGDQQALMGNPSNAKANCIQSTRLHRILKTI